MAIRDRFRRALRKSVSPGVITHTDTNVTTDSNTSTESNSSELSFFSPKRQSFLTRAFTMGPRRSSRTNGGKSSAATPTNGLRLAQQIDLTLNRTPSEAEREMKAEKKRQRKAKYKDATKVTHPRDKPLTAQNLKHQAMLGTWSWDASINSTNPRHSFVSGVSPCCTRPPSIRGDDDYFVSGGHNTDFEEGSALMPPGETQR